MDGSSSLYQANTTRMSFGRIENSREGRHARGFNIEEAGSAVKLVEEKLIKIHDDSLNMEIAERELKIDREIIAEESQSLADKDED